MNSTTDIWETILESDANATRKILKANNAVNYDAFQEFLDVIKYVLEKRFEVGTNRDHQRTMGDSLFQ